MQNEQRLIDANALTEYFERLARSLANARCFSAADAVRGAAEKVASAPTIDAVPVVHSSWGYRAYRGDARITVSGEVVCRKCHAPFFRIRGHWFKYCPNCGVKMDAKDMDVPTKDGGAEDAGR